MKEEEYQLVGIWNDMGFIPDNVYPVFKGNDDHLYWGFTEIINKDEKEKGIKYKYFYLFPDNYIEKVKYLNELDVELDLDKEKYTIGDNAIYGFQLDKKKVYIGTLDKYLDFITSYKEYLINNYNNCDKGTLLSQLQNEIDYLQEITKEDNKRILK